MMLQSSTLAAKCRAPSNLGSEQERHSRTRSHAWDSRHQVSRRVACERRWLVPSFFPKSVFEVDCNGCEIEPLPPDAVRQFSGWCVSGAVMRLVTCDEAGDVMRLVTCDEAGDVMRRLSAKPNISKE